MTQLLLFYKKVDLQSYVSLTLSRGLSRGSSPLQTPHTCCEQVASFNQIIWSDQIIEFDRSFNLYLI